LTTVGFETMADAFGKTIGDTIDDDELFIKNCKFIF
jgi:hypothetical protein